MLKLSACRQSTEAWAPMHTGKLPKACECYRQLWALSEVQTCVLLLTDDCQQSLSDGSLRCCVCPDLPPPSVDWDCV